MVIGVDFDNTIVCYDGLFHRIAVERGLIPADLPPQKNEVRDYLRRQGREQDWTEMQGYVYGARMAEAQAFPGVREFFSRGIKQGLMLYIISHKTRVPVAGRPFDLHEAARGWLKRQGFFDSTQVGLAADHVCFGATRQEKIQLIETMGCTHFVDDLEETFLEESFPAGVTQILFGRRQRPQGLADALAMPDWRRISEYVFDA